MPFPGRDPDLSAAFRATQSGMPEAVPAGRKGVPEPKRYTYGGATSVDELEAVIRRQLARVTAGHRAAFTVNTALMNEATAEILLAAQAYASTEVGLLTPAERRRVLEGS